MLAASSRSKSTVIEPTYWARALVKALEIFPPSLRGRITYHAFKGDLAACAALFVAAIGLAHQLAAALVYLHPTGFDPMRAVQRIVQVVAPHIGRQTVVRVVLWARPDGRAGTVSAVSQAVWRRESS